MKDEVVRNKLKNLEEKKYNNFKELTGVSGIHFWNSRLLAYLEIQIIIIFPTVLCSYYTVLTMPKHDFTSVYNYSMVR